jgi:hypothetical protein
LWNLLLKAEAQQYYEFQLMRAHLPAEWASDVDFLVSQPGVSLSLAQWRYCLWAAAREGAALSARRCYEPAHLRERMFEEARRRSASVASGRWTTNGFSPRADEPRSALSREFLRNFAPLGSAFFTAVPTYTAVDAQGFRTID